MYIFRIRLITLLIALQLVILHNTCFADLRFKLLNGWGFSKTESTMEHLDHDRHYNNTQATTGWTQNKEFTTFTLTPELLWTSPCNTFVKVVGSYGWVLDGKNIQYPFRWDMNGDTWGWEIEAGYIKDVCGLFTFVPFAGFSYTELDTKIKHQKFSHFNTGSFLRQNGNKIHTLLYYPYIGFEIDFKTKVCCKDIQCALSYSLGYGAGHSSNRVPHTVITDLPSTSRYNNHVKYRDIISHDLEFALAYSPAKKWLVALLFDYNIYYNTHKLPLKLDHNRELVEKAQFTRSQHHVVSDLVAHSYTVTFEIAYSLTGEGGAFISH